MSLSKEKKLKIIKINLDLYGPLCVYSCIRNER